MIFHGITTSLLLWAAISLQNIYPDANLFHWIGLILFVGLLVYQHTLVKPNDLSKINLAFFTTNGIASVVFGGLLILDFYI